MRNILPILFYFFLGGLLLGCDSPPSDGNVASAQLPTASDRQILGASDTNSRSINQPNDTTIAFVFPYDFKEPVKRIEMPHELREISALSFYKDDLLAVVQDEKGKIFIINTTTGEVEQENKFAQKGDYEGIEIVGDLAYVLRSDGDVYKVEDFLSEDTKVTKYENALRTKNDAEGLGYDPKKNWLLISCKASPHLGDERGYRGHRAVYAFDLANQSLIRKPYLLINIAHLEAGLKEGNLTHISKNIIKAIGSDVTFQPSAIATHPITGHIYVLASVGKLLVVVDQKGEIIHLEKLKKKRFNHPEGICFMPDGTLFISNEGDNKDGSILQFEMSEGVNE